MMRRQILNEPRARLCRLPRMEFLMKNSTLNILVVPAAALCALWFAGCSREQPKAAEKSPLATNVTLSASQRAAIHLQPVTISTYGRTIETTGTVGFDSDRATTVLAPISGPAAKLLVSLGAVVNAGDPLAEINSPDYAAAITAYRKCVATARNDMEQAQTDAINADADRDAALAQLTSLGVDNKIIVNIRKNVPVTNITGVIRSPLSGTVVEKLITPGQRLKEATTPCFTVANLSHVWVMADIFESDLSAVHLGDTTEVITSAAAHPYSGVVDNISAIVDPNTR